MFLIVRYLNNIFTMTIVTLATEVVAGALIYVILCLVLRAPFITVVKDFITESRSKKRED